MSGGTLGVLPACEAGDEGDPGVRRRLASMSLTLLVLFSDASRELHLGPSTGTDSDTERLRFTGMKRGHEEEQALPDGGGVTGSCGL